MPRPGRCHAAAACLGGLLLWLHSTPGSAAAAPLTVTAHAAAHEAAERGPPRRGSLRPAAPFATAYESWRPLPRFTPAERRILAQVRRQAQEQQVTLGLDGRLCEAAQDLLSWAAPHAGEPLPTGLVERLAWHRGVTDGEVAALVVQATPAQLPAALSGQLAELLGDELAANRLGLALHAPHPAAPAAHAERTPVVTLAVLLSRRLLWLAPVPRSSDAGRTLHLAGSAPLGSEAVRLIVAAPGAAIVQHDLPLAAPHGTRRPFAAQIATGPASGPLHVQLLLERGAGPEVAASFPVMVVAGAQRKPAAGRTRPDEPTQFAERAKAGELSEPAPCAQSPAAPAAVQAAGAAGPAQAGEAGEVGADAAFAATVAAGRADISEPVHELDELAELYALLYGVRAAHGLPLPLVSAPLARLAAAHAADMAEHRFFAHVSPTAGDAAARLARGGVPAVRVVENLAAAPSPSEALRQWQASPSHLANLLDAHIDRVGLGVARRASGLTPYLVVLLMAAEGP